MTYRTERDSMGDVKVPQSALYQAQTQRALQNFQLSGNSLPEPFIRALLQIKRAAAAANQQLGLLESPIASAIEHAALQQLNQLDMRQYPVDVFQTGSGTSSNMNVNEVLATLATQSLKQTVSANDHVNLGQSSNDTIPTAIHVSSALAIKQLLLPALVKAQHIIANKTSELGHIVKTGRTHLMDAMPVTFGQVLQGWQAQLQASEQQLNYQLAQLQQLPQGGTAVGTGINADPAFSALFCAGLNRLTGMAFQPASNFFALIGSQDTAVATSGALKTLATGLLKISNDLRWMNSGPLSGLAEINLPALQPGSSIMPGKVNPVIPEAVAMICVQVTANDTAITLAGQSGNFELNVMLPLIATNLLSSITLLSRACTALAEQAIAGFSVNENRIKQTLALNPILATALNPKVGYAKAADIAKQAYREQRPIIDVALEHTDYSRQQLEQLLDPARLCQGGIIK